MVTVRCNDEGIHLRIHRNTVYDILSFAAKFATENICGAEMLRAHSLINESSARQQEEEEAFPSGRQETAVRVGIRCMATR